jgi:hypothetical protein
MSRQLSIAAVYVLLLMLAVPASAQGCRPSIMESKTESLALLQAQQDNRQDPVCIQFALYGVRGSKSREVAEILVKYLDFRRPTSKEESVIRRHLVTQSDMYPAIDSLYFMEELGVPSIVTMIARDNGTDLARNNALVALTGIYHNNEPEAIARLKAEAFKRTDTDETSRLLNAAKDVVALCDVDNKEKCNEELSRQPQ